MTGRGAQGLFADTGRRVGGGEADSKHSPRDKLELDWPKPVLSPNLKEGR